MKIIKKDAIVIGGGLIGLITSHLLSNEGIEGVLIEGASFLGGINRSFKNTAGDIFDYGYHALEADRSDIAMDYFGEILDSNVRRFQLNQAVIANSNIIPYPSTLSDWPQELIDLLTRSFSTENGKKPKCMDDLREIYGEKWVDYLLTTVLNSYPQAKWQYTKGQPEDAFFWLIYPYFCPQPDNSGENQKSVLYPSDGGFGRFTDSLIKQIDKKYFDIKTGMQAQIKMNESQQEINYITVGDVNYQSNNIYWCAPLPLLGHFFSIPRIDGVPRVTQLGSFKFDREINHSGLHEILVGDPDILMNRISLPGNIQNIANDMLQIEFGFPEGDYNYTKDELRGIWLGQLRELNLISSANSVVDFDFREFRLGMVSMQNQFAYEKLCIESISNSGSDIRIPCPSAGAKNINDVIESVSGYIYNQFH